MHDSGTGSVLPKGNFLYKPSHRDRVPKVSGIPADVTTRGAIYVQT